MKHITFLFALVASAFAGTPVTNVIIDNVIRKDGVVAYRTVIITVDGKIVTVARGRVIR